MILPGLKIPAESHRIARGEGGVLSDDHRKKLASQTTVAMLTTQRSPEPLGELRDLRADDSEELLMLSKLQIQDRAEVQFAGSGVTVMHGREAMPGQNLVELTHIGWQVPGSMAVSSMTATGFHRR